MRIFISHGIHETNTDELSFLDALAARLAADGHEVLLDRKRLKAGDVWEEVLHDWLAECDAGLVLIGPRALTRSWVQNEASVLSHRKYYDKEFPLYVALRPGATAANVAVRFAAQNLGRLHTFPSDSTALEVAAGISPQTAASASPLDRLEQEIALHIPVTPAADLALQRLCAALPDPAPGRDGGLPLALQRARKIARAIVRDQWGTLGTLEALMNGLRSAGLSFDARRSILSLAAPRWVNPVAASRLGAHFAQVRPPLQQAPELALALNTRLSRYTPLMYAWRARMPYFGRCVFWVEGGGSDMWSEELYGRILKAYREGKHDRMPDDASAKTALDNLLVPVFFVLPPPIPDGELLAELRARLPKVAFIALTGSEDAASNEMPEGVLLLEPLVDPTVEARNYSDYVTAEDAISPSPY